MPKSYVGGGRHAASLAKDGGTEPLGDRIIPLPQDAAEALLRDPHVRLRRLRAARQRRRGQGAGHHRRRRQDRALRRLSRTEARRHRAKCPPIAGRTATYIFRQLNDIHAGARNGTGRRDHAARGREPDAARHDRDRRLCAIARSVTAGFYNLGDLIPRDRDLTKIAIIDLGGEQSAARIHLSRSSTPWRTASRARSPSAACSAATASRSCPPTAPNIIAAYYGIMRAGFVAVPVNFKFPARDHPFHPARCRRQACVLRRARARPIARRIFRQRDVRRRSRDGFERFLDPGPFDAIVPRAGRAGDVSLHLRLDRHAERRRALAPEPHLGGGDAARARARPPPLSDRGAALSHERAGAGEARLRGARHHRAAAAIHRARLYRGDRALSLHLAHRRAADDRHDAARARPAGARPISPASSSCAWARRR